MLITCQYCGQLFKPARSYITYRNTKLKFCSKSHASLHHWANHRKPYSHHCETCGKQYNTAYDATQKYCSKQCNQKALRARPSFKLKNKTYMRNRRNSLRLDLDLLKSLSIEADCSCFYEAISPLNLNGSSAILNHGPTLNGDHPVMPRLSSTSYGTDITIEPRLLSKPVSELTDEELLAEMQQLQAARGVTATTTASGEPRQRRTKSKTDDKPLLADLDEI